MRSLVVEDDATARALVAAHLSYYGNVEAVSDGYAAVEAMKKALEAKDPYRLICLDIMMPGKDGRTTLTEIRDLEKSMGILLGDGAKIVMTTCLSDSENVLGSFKQQCDGYLVKPIEKSKLVELMIRFGFVKG